MWAQHPHGEEGPLSLPIPSLLPSYHTVPGALGPSALQNCSTSSAPALSGP